MKLFYTFLIIFIIAASCAPPEYRYETIKGKDGKDGRDGANGHSAIYTTTSASSSQCSNGGTVILTAVDLDDNQVLDLTDGNIQSVVVCNGLNGQDGSNGTDGQNAPPTPFTPVGLLDPCGTNPNLHNEVFLKLADGTVLASFSDNVNGYNTRFSILTAGTYQTTDGDGCVFTIDASGTITSENHHY